VSFRCRVARRASTARHLAATTAQAAVFWTFFLGVLPAAIDAAIPPPAPPPAWAKPLASGGAALFVLASALGLTSAFVMAACGRGTPLPLAAAAKLVVVGPYRFVRNPMAIAGTLQGLGVAAWRASPAVAVYALAGAVFWQWAVRPREEDDLRARFGAEYDAYRARVRCWIPRLPHRQSPEAPPERARPPAS
jgi:protein-S-isoprenylcysteine O-methyltransferase Ste14